MFLMLGQAWVETLHSNVGNYLEGMGSIVHTPSYAILAQVGLERKIAYEVN